MDGYIKLHRKICQNKFWNTKPFSKGQAWIDILLRVNHEPKDILIGTISVHVEPGETLWSIKDMAEKWGWSRKKVGAFLDVLESDSMLSQNRTSKYTILTVVNWDVYQTAENQKNIKSTSNAHQKHTNKNDKNDKNKKRSITSNTKKKSPKNEFSDASYEMRAAMYLYNQILRIRPNYKEPNLQKWALEIDRALRIDKRDPTELAKVLEFATKDPFWQKNILSTKSFRDQYDRLAIQMHKPKKGNVDQAIENLEEWLESEEA